MLFKSQVKESLFQRCLEVEQTAREQATDNVILDQLQKVSLKKKHLWNWIYLRFLSGAWFLNIGYALLFNIQCINKIEFCGCFWPILHELIRQISLSNICLLIKKRKKKKTYWMSFLVNRHINVIQMHTGTLSIHMNVGDMAYLLMDSQSINEFWHDLEIKKIMWET